MRLTKETLTLEVQRTHFSKENQGVNKFSRGKAGHRHSGKNRNS